MCSFALCPRIRLWKHSHVLPPGQACKSSARARPRNLFRGEGETTCTKDPPGVSLAYSDDSARSLCFLICLVFSYSQTRLNTLFHSITWEALIPIPGSLFTCLLSHGVAPVISYANLLRQPSIPSSVEWQPINNTPQQLRRDPSAGVTREHR